MELRNAVLTAATLATLASPLNSLAQFATADTRSGSALEEIVVTAQKRSESLQSVPIAITALGAEELASRGITGIGSLNRGEVPALRVQPFAGQQTVYLMTIRGVSQSSGADVSFENPVPLYIDDVYYGRASGLGLELNELERIEVLRGPQGTLFGKNAVGGAVRFISKAPTGEFGLRSTFEAGNFGYWKVLGHIDLPSVAGIATKLDVLATDNDGWQKNPAPGQENFGRLKSTGIKFSALTRPVDGLTLDFAADYTDVKSTEVFNQLLSSTDPYLLAAWQPQPHRVETIPGPTYRPLSPEHYWGGRLTATWDISSSVSLKSISAYRDDRTYLHNTATTSAALPGALIGSTIPYLSGPTVIYDINHSQFSEELQLVGTHDTVQWVTGLFFMREHASEISTTYFGTA